ANVGQDEAPDGAEALPLSFGEVTPRGFVNDLTRFGYPGEFVYDTCREGAWCDPGDARWKAFRQGKAWLDRAHSSIHHVVVHRFGPVPIYLAVGNAGCGYAIAPASDTEDADGDGIPDACDPCDGDACRSFADAREQLSEIGIGAPAASPLILAGGEP